MGAVVILTVMGALGGITAFLGAVWVVVRAIFRQSSVTRDNTDAVTELSGHVKDLSREFHGLAERVARLEGERHGSR